MARRFWGGSAFVPVIDAALSGNAVSRSCVGAGGAGAVTQAIASSLALIGRHAAVTISELLASFCRQCAKPIEIAAYAGLFVNG